MLRKKRAQPKPPPSRQVDVFLEMMAAERGAATNTIAAYRTDRFTGMTNPWIDYTTTLMALQPVP